MTGQPAGNSSGLEFSEKLFHEVTEMCVGLSEGTNKDLDASRVYEEPFP